MDELAVSSFSKEVRWQIYIIPNLRVSQDIV